MHFIKTIPIGGKALYDVEDYDTILLTKARKLNSPEHVKEEIRQRNIILGISND